MEKEQFYDAVCLAEETQRSVRLPPPMKTAPRVAYWKRHQKMRRGGQHPDGTHALCLEQR
jgi:hypothetical protein